MLFPSPAVDHDDDDDDDDVAAAGQAGATVWACKVYNKTRRVLFA